MMMTVLLANLLQSMRASGSRQDRRAGSDLVVLPIERHQAAAAEHVIDFVFRLFVVLIPDPGLSTRLRNTSSRFGALAEERMADRQAATAMRARLQVRRPQRRVE